MRLIFTFLLYCCAAFYSELYSQSLRTRDDFDNGWKFHLGDIAEPIDSDFNDASWRMLDLPHDWSVELPFDSTSPTGTGGGALRGGVGWYRKTFILPDAYRERKIFIDFDGIYMNSEVWINGHPLGVRPNGYISFRYDLTPYVTFGKKKNVVIVKVDNSKQPNSRWYSGSGIYRNVWLVTTGKLFVDHWGTYVTCNNIGSSSATAAVTININNANNRDENVVARTIFFDQNGKQVAVASSNITARAGITGKISQIAKINSPQLWSISHPYLYKAVTHLSVGGRDEDVYETDFGIRYFRFDAGKGFFLNGKPLKIIGVCDHHDLGCLGTALNTRALERQLEMLKSMGINGIRTSHNPPAPELLDLADKMGFIVMDEAFDMWKKPKNPYDYHLYWDEWHGIDLRDQILRDRNHPSVFIWSIGNEIPEQWGGKNNEDSSGKLIARELASIIHDLDTTRPITSALNNPWPGNQIYGSGALDLVGFNYHQGDYKTFLEKFPGQKFIGTETVSSLNTRGHYDMPSDSIRRWPERWDKPFNGGNSNLTCSAYDNCSAPWGSTHEETLKELLKYDFASGMFVWTGFDYIGEPTPYPWPARSSYFGIIDLAGFPKDAYYLYQSLFTDSTVLHIFPHWNWEPGQMIDIWAYYNHADEVELYLNGKSLGTRKKNGDDLHVMWRVAFEPGTIKAVSRKNGTVVTTKEIHTAGSPARIILIPDRSNIRADGKDLSFITAKVVDKDGNLVPNADNIIDFSIVGKGAVIATDNGNETDLETFKSKKHRAFNGLCLAVVQSVTSAGKIAITANSPGLKSATVEISSR